MRGIFLLLGWLIALPGLVLCQLVHEPEFEKLAWQGMDAMYAQNFAQAQAIFTRMRDQNPQHPIGYFVLAGNDWWKLLLNTNDTQWDAPINHNLDECLARCQAVLEKDENDWEGQFFYFAAWALKARVLSTHNKLFEASRAALKCLPALKHQLHQQGALQYEFLFGLGLYHYYVEWFGEHKPAAKTLMWLFPAGDKQKGLQELRTCADHRNYTQLEAAFFLVDILANFEGQPAHALRYSRMIAERYPNSTIFLVEHAKTLTKNGYNNEAEKLLLPLVSTYEALASKGKPIRADRSTITTQLMEQVYLTLAQNVLAVEKNVPKAQAWLAKAQQCCQLNGDNNTLWASQIYLHQGYCYDKLGQREQAIEAYHKAKSAGDDDQPHRRAEACLEKPCTN